MPLQRCGVFEVFVLLLAVLLIEHGRNTVLPHKTRLCSAKFDKALFTFDIGCPTEFYLEAGTVFKADEAYGKVLNIKGSAINFITEP